MLKYFSVQCKRLLRFFPGALCVAVALMLCLLIAYDALTAPPAEDPDEKVTVAFTGQSDNALLQMGLSTLSSLDTTRFAMELVQMDQDAAMKALSRGEVSVCIVIPEGFMEGAMQGDLIPLQFISNSGSTGLVSIFKEEITSVVSTILLHSQKGVFAYGNVLDENGYSSQSSTQMNRMAFTYVDCILVRDRIYTMEELGIADALPLEDYLLCGLTVLLFMLICLPFGPMLISPDTSLGRMLSSRGRRPLSQVVTEFFAYFLFLWVLITLVLAVAASNLPFPEVRLWMGQTLPVILMVATFSFMLYSCAGHMISGILTYFFGSLALCFISGCLYPVFFFPITLQKLAAWLPTGLARSQISGLLTGEIPAHTGLYLLIYSVLFFGIGAWVRCRRIKGVHQQ